MPPGFGHLPPTREANTPGRVLGDNIQAVLKAFGDNLSMTHSLPDSGEFS